MNIQGIIFLPLLLGALGYSNYKLWRLFQLMKNHQGKKNLVKNTSERIKETLKNVLGQKAVLRKKPIGIAHALIFWGFIIISVGTLEQFISTLFPGFHFDFVGETLYGSFLFLHDLFTMLVCLGVGYALYRRLVLRPEGPGKSSDALVILVLTGALMVSIFLMHSFYIQSGNFVYESSLPFSKAFSHLLPMMSSEQAWVYGDVFKWIHMIIVLGFSCYIPSSKHLHIIAAGPNTYFKNLRPEKSMTPINFEDESVTQYGAGKVTDLSWKDALDYFACTECGRCQDLCPAWNTDKPLSPKRLIVDLKDNLYRNQEAVLQKKYDDVSSVMDEKVTSDVIWACTSCRACEVACPVFIEQTDKIYDIRRNLVMMESSFPQEVQPVFKNMETNGTPWAFSASDRDQWAKDLSLKRMSDSPDVDVLFWVGCAGSYDDRNKKVVTALSNLLQKAGVSFAILGNEEQCTGDPARRIGNEYLFQMLAQANVETLNRYQVKKIVTACPHCFNTLKNEYPHFGGVFEVYHHSEFLASLIKEGKLRPSKVSEDTITFHDSCYLGRWNKIYDQPRSVLQSLPSAKLVEMKQNHDQSLCCGAGGGRMWMEETLGKRINVVRTEQALETKAQVVASSCPFCMTMLNDGVKTKEASDRMQVKDIAEILEQSMN